MSVVDLAEARLARGDHLAGPVRCLGCRHEWTAVAPIGTTQLECPECGCERGVWIFPFGVEVGKPRWVCNCGNEHFFLTERHAICAGCGIVSDWEPVA